MMKSVASLCRASILLAAGTILLATSGVAQNNLSQNSLSFVGAAPMGADDSAPTPPKSVHSLDLTAIDKTADPCTNFYQYACGNWIKDNPVPADQTRWARSFSIGAAPASGRRHRHHCQRLRSLRQPNTVM